MKLLSLTLCLSILCAPAFSQWWGGNTDEETLHFGFMFEYMSSKFSAYKKPSWRNPYPNFQKPGGYLTDSINGISCPPTPGFGLGFVIDLRLLEHVNLRLTPDFSFADRKVYYVYQNAYSKTQMVKAYMANFPLDLKIKSIRHKNFRAYFLSGLRFGRDMVSKDRIDDQEKPMLEKILKNKRNLWFYEAGLGFDFYLEFFKLSSEIKYVHSIGNVLVNENNPYASPLEKLFLKNLVLSLYFE